VSSSGRSGPVDVDEMEEVSRVFIVRNPQAQVEGSIRLRTGRVTIMEWVMIVGDN
jgi:hypothetical protein